MAINPLQLPGPLVVPQLNFALLDKIGDAIGEYRQRSALADAIPGLVGGNSLGTLGQPQAPQAAPTGAQAPTGSGLSQDQMALLKQKADQYGIDPNYLIKTASIEGTTKNPASSATGLGQFIDSTAKQYGVARGDDASAADGLARFTVDNQAALTKALGRPPTSGELYLAHQQGAQGAINLLSHPDAPAVAVVGPEAVVNNGGSPQMTAAQFAAKWTAPFGQPGSTATAFAGDPSQAPMPATAGPQPQQQQQITGGAPASAPSAASAPQGANVSPEMIQRLQAMIRAGGPAQAMAMAMIQKYIVPPQPVVIGEGGVAVNPVTGQVIARGQSKSYPVAPGGSLVTPGQAPGAGGGATYQNNSGKLEPASIDGLAKRYLETGDDKIISDVGNGTMGALNRTAVLNRVEELRSQGGQSGGDIINNKGTSEARVQAAKDFATGTQGNTVRSLNVATDHLSLLRNLARAMDGGTLDVPAMNALTNAWRRETGSDLPTNFNAAKHIVAAEIAKAVTGSGGALGDREELAAPLNAANSWGQLSGVIDKAYLPLMAGQMKGLKQQYQSATGKNDFDSKVSERTRAELSKGDQSAAPAVPKITSRDDANAAIGQAKAAIAAGAPRDAVVQRLRQMGVPPVGL